MGSQPRFHGLGDVLRDEGEGVAPVAYFRWLTDSCFQRKADRHSCWSEISPVCTAVYEREKKRTMLKTPVRVFSEVFSQSRLAQELGGGNLKFRWAEKLPLTVLSARSEKEVAKCPGPSTLLADKIMQREFLPSSQYFNQGFILRGNSTLFFCVGMFYFNYDVLLWTLWPVQSHQIPFSARDLFRNRNSWYILKFLPLSGRHVKRPATGNETACLLKVYFSHDLHPPSYPQVKESAGFPSLYLFQLLVTLNDCKAPPFLLTGQCPKHAPIQICRV